MDGTLILAETDFWIPVAGLLIVTVVGFLIAMRLRDAAKAEPKADGFTLEELRQLRRDGKLTDEEFESASTQLKALLRRDATPPASGSTPERNPRSPRQGR